MAIPIKAIPTLYGDEARRMMIAIEEAEKRFEQSPKRNKSKESRHMAMKKFLAKSNMN